MNKQRISILIVAAVGMAAAFMPWITVPIMGGVSGFQSTPGKISFVLFLVPMVLCFLGDRNKDLNRKLHITTMIFGVLAIVSTAIQFLVITNNETENPLEQLFSEVFQIGIGLYLTAFAAVMLPVLTLVMKNSKAQQAGEEEMDTSLETSRFVATAPIEKTPEIPKEEKEELLDASLESSRFLNKEQAEESPKEEKEEGSVDKEDYSRFMPK